MGPLPRRIRDRGELPAGQTGLRCANTAYINLSRTTLRIRFEIDESRVAHDAASDGMWPLITNDTSMTPAELLTAYKCNPTSRSTPNSRAPNSSPPCGDATPPAWRGC
jgi:hypothetical protein